MDKAAQDLAMQRIWRTSAEKDIQQLKVHFQCLTDNTNSTQFSAMYINLYFSMIQAL